MRHVDYFTLKPSTMRFLKILGVSLLVVVVMGAIIYLSFDSGRQYERLFGESPSTSEQPQNDEAQQADHFCELHLGEGENQLLYHFQAPEAECDSLPFYIDSMNGEYLSWLDGFPAVWIKTPNMSRYVPFQDSGEAETEAEPDAIPLLKVYRLGHNHEWGLLLYAKGKTYYAKYNVGFISPEGKKPRSKNEDRLI